MDMNKMLHCFGPTIAQAFCLADVDPSTHSGSLSAAASVCVTGSNTGRDNALTGGGVEAEASREGTTEATQPSVDERMKKKTLTARVAVSVKEPLGHLWSRCSSLRQNNQ